MSDTDNLPPLPSLEDFQHWTGVMGRAQQMLMEYVLSTYTPEKAQGMMAEWMSPGKWQQAMAMFTPPAKVGIDTDAFTKAAEKMQAGAMPDLPAAADPAQWMNNATSFWTDSVKMWQEMAANASAGLMGGGEAQADDDKRRRDKRFAHEAWDSHPLFQFIRQSYLTLAEQLEASVDAVDGIDPKAKEQMRFATRGIIDAISPSNFALTNPQVIERTLETRGENLLKGLEHMLADLKKGQMTHTDPTAFEVGRNLAATPGKVVYETPLFQLVHYAPTTDRVLDIPLLIFPPWINRFYILDLNSEKSFIKWCVEQGISTFIVSWKSADTSMKDVVWDDYISAQLDAIDQVRDLLDVKGVHTIGYCVAGTTLAATLAVLAAKGEDKKVKSATFFTAQVDFEKAGDLTLFIDDAQMRMIEAMSGEGYLDGRYMAATFNALRGRDLIWNYVVNNYLLGQDSPPFDLLHWNGDTTNLPLKWHKDYLADLYRDNKLVQPGALSANGVKLDLTKVKTPTYVQAGREDHIAPPESVWRIMDHFKGPITFLLAGSGHIAGVVNPPSAGKYQYWTNEGKVDSLEDFVAGAKETKGSWWPHWLGWLKDQSAKTVTAQGARVPGKGKLKAIEDAPGRYVKSR